MILFRLNILYQYIWFGSLFRHLFIFLFADQLQLYGYLYSPCLKPWRFIMLLLGAKVFFRFFSIFPIMCCKKTATTNIDYLQNTIKYFKVNNRVSAMYFLELRCFQGYCLHVTLSTTSLQVLPMTTLEVFNQITFRDCLINRAEKHASIDLFFNPSKLQERQNS